MQNTLQIVVLDAYSLNPGDLSWQALEQLGSCKIYDRTAPTEVMERIAGAEVVLTNKVVLGESHFSTAPQLKYIGVMATGFNVVDIKAARAHGIAVSNIPAYSTMSVAQMVFAHLLNIAQQVQHHSEAVHAGRWASNPDFCFWDTPLCELSGKKMGIVGLGNTGMATARIALAMGMDVWAYTSKSADALPEGIRKASFDEIFSQCDVVSLHCPLNESTHHLVNKERLARMKSTAILINTGRGPLVCEEDLADALRSGQIRAAGLDVMGQEPPKADNPLLGLKNCYITPHIAWASFEARQRLMDILIDNVKSYISGNPLHIVN